MIKMNLFGHGQWYTGELNPNQFAADNNGQLAQTQQKQGLSDAFNGAEMGMNQAQPSNGPLNNQTRQPMLGGFLPNLSPMGKALVGIGGLMAVALVMRKVRR
tara:strand:+ start:8240 stop:8545 length:306 start_codon:yes stop_codon:yes gene_type:complete